MAGALDDSTWEMLINRIRVGRCTPFVGAGACAGVLPTGGQLAKEWATRFGYSFGNCENLIEVAQFLAVRFDPLRPKELVLERFKGIGPPKFEAADEPHGVLAKLPLSVYVTTNYDDFLFRALGSGPFRKPLRDFCRWHPALRDFNSPLGADFKPHAAHPLVFHLHGMLELDGDTPLPQSLVLTEDDYIQFLAGLIRNQELLPPVVARALRDHTCLFLGYRLADWNFRIIFEGLRDRLSSKSIAVLLPPGKTDEEQEAARRYFEQYYRRTFGVEVFWGTAQEFCAQLKARMGV